MVRALLYIIGFFLERFTLKLGFEKSLDIAPKW